MTLFYKILNGMTPSYLFEYIPENRGTTVSLRGNMTRLAFFRTERYENSFFTFVMTNWNNLDDSIKSLHSLKEFKNNLSKSVRAKGNIFTQYVTIVELNY